MAKYLHAHGSISTLHRGLFIDAYNVTALLLQEASYNAEGKRGAKHRECEPQQRLGPPNAVQTLHAKVSSSFIGPRWSRTNAKWIAADARRRTPHIAETTAFDERPIHLATCSTRDDFCSITAMSYPPKRRRGAPQVLERCDLISVFLLPGMAGHHLRRAPRERFTQGRHMVPSSELQSKNPTWCFLAKDNAISRALSASDHANAAYIITVPMQ